MNKKTLPKQTLAMLQKQTVLPTVIKRRLNKCCEANPYCPLEKECVRLYHNYVDATPNPLRIRQCKDPTQYKNDNRYEVPQGRLII